MQTFGWELLQFARAVDHLTEENLGAIEELVNDYFLDPNGLDAIYFCVHRSGGRYLGEEVLKTDWSSESKGEFNFVPRFQAGDVTESSSLRALAYNEDYKLWVNVKTEVDTEEGLTLDQVSPADLEDNWPERQRARTTSLPRYMSTHDKPCRTLIALPLKYVEQQLGVLVIEFDRRIPCTESAKQEAELISQALARILWLKDAVDAQYEITRNALDLLKESVKYNISSVDPPRLFFAFPKDTDKNVTAIIKTILDTEYSNRILLISWDSLHDPGQITDQVVEEISNCKFGICYFSEYSIDDTEPEQVTKYRDNSNVLIEAGMLDVLVHNRLAPTSAWIPVREADILTGQKPFDFNTERMIEIPRDEDGNLRQDTFAEIVRDRINRMLNA